jgi:periplasmic protein TonB
VENQPSFKGGQEAMVKFLMENIQYPPEAKKKGVQGTVFVQFVVKADGSVTNVKVLRGIGSGCDEEAFRVVKLMPKWNPGTEKGKPVSVAFNLPIKFKLDAKGGEKKPVKK